MELHKARPSKNEDAITVSEKYSESLDLVLTPMKLENASSFLYGLVGVTTNL